MRTFTKCFVVLAAFGATAFALRGHPRVPEAKGFSADIGERVLVAARRLGLALDARASTVQVLEFSDFECPACKDAQTPIRQLASEGKIAVTFVPYVIDSHAGSRAKALAYLGAASALDREQLADRLWATVTPPQTHKVPAALSRLEECRRLAREIGVVAVPTFLVRLPDGRWSVTNGTDTIRMLSEGRMVPDAGR